MTLTTFLVIVVIIETLLLLVAMKLWLGDGDK